jgi:hypothetical protein
VGHPEVTNGETTTAVLWQEVHFTANNQRCYIRNHAIAICRSANKPILNGISCTSPSTTAALVFDLESA